MRPARSPSPWFVPTVLALLAGCSADAGDGATDARPGTTPPASSLLAKLSAGVFPGTAEGTHLSSDTDRYAAALNDCPGSWDPVCRRAVTCPEPTDPVPPGSSSVTTGTLPPAAFCPSGTAPGGVTATCTPGAAGYTRGSSPQPWLDACTAAGHGTYLPGADDSTDTAPLPFLFPFYGTVNTSVGLSSNGMLSFGPASSLWINAPLPHASTPNTVFPLWDDLVLRQGVCTATFGTAPSRQFVAEWSDAYFNTDHNAHLTFEVVLTEGSATLDVLYNRMDTGAQATGGHATVGIQQGASGPADQVSYDLAGSVPAGTSVRWTPTPAMCTAGVYTRVYTAGCTDLGPVILPLWGQFQYTSSVPPGTAIHLEARAAATSAGLASAPAIALPDAPLGTPTAATTLDLGQILRAASPNAERQPYLQLTAHLVPTVSGNASPTLGSVEARYDCNPTEYLTLCAPGSACNPGAPCRLGVLTCPIPQRAVCTDAGPAPVGAACGPAMVCSPTATCVACADGTPCTLSAQCTAGRISCATGAPVCMATSSMPAGTPCGGSPPGYTRATSPQAWLDACAAPGHGTYLAGADDATDTAPLPFSFPYYGVAYTSVGLSSNGMLSFGPASSLWVNTPLPNAGAPNTVFALWADLVLRQGVCTATFGSAPSRQFVAEWNDVYIHGGFSTDLTFETVLTERSGTLDVLYNRLDGFNHNGHSSHVTVGIQQDTGTAYDQVTYNDYSPITVGQGFQWTPTSGGQCDGLGTCRACTAEVCNGIDDNCNGVIDEGCSGAITCPGAVTTQAGTAVPLSVTATGMVAGLTWAVATGPTGGASTAVWSPSPPTGTSVTFNPTIVGNYTVQVSGTDGGGHPLSCTVPVTAVSHGLRIELTWDGPGDLDVHLHDNRSTPWYSTDDCFYSNMDTSFGAVLDFDNTVALGPENIRVDAPLVGSTYTLAVHNYARGAGRTATVRVYCGTTAGTIPTAVFTSRPFTGNSSGDCTANDFWRIGQIVFSSLGACTITPINTYAPSTSACGGL